MRNFVRCIQRAASEFLQDDCMSNAAAMAYYSIFSLPALLLLALMFAENLGLSGTQIRQVAQQHLGLKMADDNAAAPHSESSDSPLRLSWWSRVGGVVLLIVSAMGLFLQMQVSLNRAWDVAPGPGSENLLGIAIQRVISCGMVLLIVLLLIASLFITLFLQDIVSALSGEVPSAIGQWLGVLLKEVCTLAVMTLLFALLFKVVPDARIAWRDVWVGAFLTATLFVLGETWIGRLLQVSNLSASWGSAAASTVGVLVWIYYSMLIILFGAEVTQSWANSFGRGIEPKRGAIRVSQRMPP